MSKNVSLFIGAKEAQEILGFGQTKFYELRKYPEFPKPKFPTGRRPAYLRSEIENWAKNVK